MKIELEVKSAVIYKQDIGPDEIVIEIEGESPFPHVPGAKARISVQTMSGYAEEWCKKNLNISPPVKTFQRRIL